MISFRNTSRSSSMFEHVECDEASITAYDYLETVQSLNIYNLV